MAARVWWMLVTAGVVAMAAGTWLVLRAPTPSSPPNKMDLQPPPVAVAPRAETPSINPDPPPATTGGKELRPLVRRLLKEDPEAKSRLISAGNEAVSAILDELGNSDEDYQVQHRAVEVLRAVRTPEAQAALLKIALGEVGGTNENLRAWAAANFIRNLDNRAEATVLLGSKDATVQSTALEALEGQALDEAAVSRLAELARSSTFNIRWRTASVLGAFPGNALVQERAQAALATVVGVDELAGADKTAPVVGHLQLTQAQYTYANCIKSLTGMRGAELVLQQLTARVQGDQESCVVVARAMRGDQGAKPGVLTLLQDPRAGILRAHAAESLGLIGSESDLPLLRNLQQSDPLKIEWRTDVGPVSSTSTYPVRTAAAGAIDAITQRTHR